MLARALTITAHTTNLTKSRNDLSTYLEELSPCASLHRLIVGGNNCVCLRPSNDCEPFIQRAPASCHMNVGVFAVMY